VVLAASHLRRNPMDSNRKILVGAALVVLVGGGWYAFRPERAFIDQTVSEALPAAEMQGGAYLSAAAPSALATGSFHSVAHETKGTATVLQGTDGKRILRLTGFETSNGPDVHVYLVAAADAKDNATVTSAGFVDLGSLKGNIGDQNYEIPADLDLAKYRAATIWCKRFGVNFGTAPLAASVMAGAPQATRMAEPTPAGMEPVALLSGRFHSNAHETVGTATVHRLDDGRRILRLTQFETSNGPDVRVYLVAAGDVTEEAAAKRAGILDLGAMKGNKGDQNYEIPAEVDLAKYRAVSIWCRRFGVNFGAAPLRPVSG
jgi:hypothetical protein